MNPHIRVLGALVLAASLSSTASVAALPGDFKERSATEKCSILLAAVQGDRYAQLPNSAFGAIDMLKMFSPSYLIQSFTKLGDEMPLNRKKLIHTYGSTASVELRITNPAAYTGIFRGGALGLARLSIATPDVSQFTPGMGLKFPISAQESVNFVIMPSLDGQGTDTNPMRHSYTSVVPAPSRMNFLTRLLENSFRKTAEKLRETFGSGPRNERTLPLDGGALVSADGAAVTDPVIPFEMVFVPSAELQQALDAWIAANPGGDFRDALAATVQDGTVLGRINLRADAGEPLEDVGELVARSAFHAGPYQDQRLYFPHQFKTRKL